MIGFFLCNTPPPFAFAVCASRIKHKKEGRNKGGSKSKEAPMGVFTKKKRRGAPPPSFPAPGVKTRG